MRHYRIKPDERGLPMEIASMALSEVRGLSTARPGSMYIPNGDGTGTLIGELAGSDETGGANGVAPWVGDTTPPGRPSGISCSSAWGTLYVTWDGTLEGGVPADFAYVSVLVDGQEIERLTGAGTAVREDLENGSTVQVSAVAYDAARDSLGNPAPNASEPWGPVSVRISDERAEIDAKVDAAEEAANKAAQDAQEAWDKAEQQAQAVADAVEKAQQAADKADKAMSDLSDTANELTGQITQVTTKVNGVEQDVEELSTSVSGAVKTAEGALTAATEAKQTAEGVSATATQALTTAQGALNKAAEVEITANGLSTQVTAAMDTATDALNKAAEVEVTADGIQADLTKNYISKTDAANTYATKASLSATAEGLQADISEVTATAEGALEKANSLEVTAEGLRADLTETTSTADSALKKANATEVTVNGMKQTLTETTNTANSALNKSTSLETSVNGIKTQVDSVSKTADSALSKASAAQQDITGFKTTVSNTYETKKDADAAMAQEVLDRNSAITQKANQILSEVKSNYVDKATGQTYASKTYVDQREDAILQAVETEYQSKDGMSSYYTKTQIDQQRDQIELGVSQSIADISIGGTNLLLGTKAFTNSGYASTENGYLRSGWTVQSEKYQGLTVRGGTKSGTAQQVVGEWLVNEFALGEEFTLSFWVKGTGGKVRAYFYGATGYATTMRVASSDGQAASGYGDGNTDLPVSSGWKRVWVTWRINSTGSTTVAKYALIRADSTASGKTVYVCGAKLEKGNKPTDWSPAPEDTAKELSSLTVSLNGITGKVSDLEGNQSTFQQTVNGFEGRLTTAESNASSAKSTATTANNTANSAKTTATNAQNTANTANSNANTAKTNASTALSTANTAKTTATNAQTTANTANTNANTAKSNASTALNRVTVHDTRDTNQNPQWYIDNYPMQMVQEFKSSSAIGLSVGTYCYLVTYVPWVNNSGGYPKQTAKVEGTGKEYWRVGTSGTAWSSWVDAYQTAVNSAKTATNYLGFSSGGIVVGTNSGGTGQSGLQGNVRLYSGGMEVRNGTTVLASYGASTIELGKNSTSCQIKMCGGKGYISYGSHTLNEGSASNCFTINSSDPIYLNSSKGVYINGLSALRGRSKTKAGGNGLVWYYITLTGGITIAFGQAQISSGSGSTIEYAFSDYSTPDSSLFKFYVVNATVERMSNPTAYDANWEVTPIVTRTSSSQFRVTLMRGDYAFLAPNSRWYISLVAFGWNESAD